MPPWISKAWHAHYRCRHGDQGFQVKALYSPSRAPVTLHNPARCPNSRCSTKRPALSWSSPLPHPLVSTTPCPRWWPDADTPPLGEHCLPRRPHSVDQIHPALSEIPRAQASDCRSTALRVQHWPRSPPTPRRPPLPLGPGPSSRPSFFSPLPSRGGSGGSWKGRDEVILSLGVSWWRRGCGRRERAQGEERNVQVRGAPRRPLLLLLLAAAAARAAAAGPGRRGARAAGRGARGPARAAGLGAASQAALLRAPNVRLAGPSAQPAGGGGGWRAGAQEQARESGAAGREAGARRGGGGRRRQQGQVSNKGGLSFAAEASWPLSQTGG